MTEAMSEQKELTEVSQLTRRIIAVAKEAGAILLSYYQKENFTTDLKNNDAFDPVTTADRAADDFLRNKINELFPDDLVLSEENDDIPTDYSKRIWMIDPLDGTKEFLNRTDGFAINIGLWSEGKILFGLVSAPALGRLFFAGLGEGAFEQNVDGSLKKLQVSSVTNLKDARLITRAANKETRPLDLVADSLEVKEKITESKIKICRVACGEADAHLNTNFRCGKWDTLAGQLILEEAGGVMTDIEGQPLDYNQRNPHWEKSFLAANNTAILDQIVSAAKAEKK